MLRTGPGAGRECAAPFPGYVIASGVEMALAHAAQEHREEAVSDGR